MNSPLIEGLITKAIRWWQTLKPQAKTLLLGLAGAMGLIAVVFLVVEIPHRQAAPLKAKIQRERDRLQPHDRLQLEHDARKLENDARTALIQGLGGAALIIGLLFTWRSIRVTERNLQITQDTAAKNLAIAQEGQITERFTRAIEQLGSDKLEVRLGAIYALERIARDSERDHWPIMEILTSYVRERVPWEVEDAEEQSVWDEMRPSERLQSIQNKQNKEILLPGTDIQAILTVLGRRSQGYGKGEDQRLDLAFTNLHGTNLRGANLAGADFLWANFRGANLRGVNFRGANLDEADFTLARCLGAQLQGACLRNARLKRGYNLTVEQLSTVQTLFRAELNPSLRAQIQQQYPHLLEEPQE